MRFAASSQFGNDWNLHCDDPNGKTWSSASIQLILLQEIRQELKGLRSEINTIRHFFHLPGVQRAVVAASAVVNRKETQRKARLRAQRRRRRLAKHARQS